MHKGADTDYKERDEFIRTKLGDLENIDKEVRMAIYKREEIKAKIDEVDKEQKMSNLTEEAIGVLTQQAKDIQEKIDDNKKDSQRCWL